MAESKRRIRRVIQSDMEATMKQLAKEILSLLTMDEEAR